MDKELIAKLAYAIKENDDERTTLAEQANKLVDQNREEFRQISSLITIFGKAHPELVRELRD